MGTHTNIAAGYGFADLAGTAMDGVSFDARLLCHPDAVVERLGLGGDLTREAFLDWLDARAAALPVSDLAARTALRLARIIVEGSPAWTPRESLVWEPEYGVDSALVLVQPGTLGLRRYRDGLDRLMLIARHGIADSGARVEPIPLGLDPCWDVWCDARDGRRVRFDTWDVAGDDPDRPARVAALGDAEARRLTGMAAKEALNHLALEVPASILLFAEWCGLCAPAAVRRMKPLLCTWWG